MKKELLLSNFSNLIDLCKLNMVATDEEVHVPLLQFADYILIFCKLEEAILENLQKTSELFKWCSGKKINWEKFSICGINIEDNKVSSVASRLNCKIESLPIKTRPSLLNGVGGF